MADVISMDDFEASKTDATNLSEEERLEADMEASMNQADELLDLITDATDADHETLYFLWSNINHILVNACGWSREDLQKDIGDVEIWDDQEGQ